MNHFEKCFSRYDTDKVIHGFHIPYEETFFHLRDTVNLVFEIGVWRGGSIRGFRDYFPNSEVVGLEIKEGKQRLSSPGATVEIGDATDEAFIGRMLSKYGPPDIVIDDGSHKSSHIKKTFDLLFPATRICYVIEDLGTQRKDYKNGRYIDDSVPATEIVHHEIEKLMLHRERQCRSVRVYTSIAFFFKEREDGNRKAD